MRLHSLEIQGFKTFPNKTKLTFLDGISAVVGPNGSGKSNISDAVRWVLGEQSVKMLRCSKMEDVIFSGTQMKKSQGFAEVTLTLQNNDESDDSEEKKTVITRRYYRSGESEYLINNKQVRLKDINELLMDTGLGKDGYSVIGQGKIDSIISARPEERRELFEEAVGISKYRHRRAEANKKLKQSEENLVRINDILSELESRIGPLQRQSEKAQKYIEYAEERKLVEISVWLRNLRDLSDFLSNQKVNIETVVHQKSEIDDNLEKIEQQTNEVFEENNKLAVALEQNRKIMEESSLEINSAQNNVLILKNEIKHNTENIQNFLSEVDEIKASGKKLLEILELKRRKAHGKESKVDEINLELNKKKEELLKLTENFQKEMVSYNEKFKKASELEEMLSKNNIDKVLCRSSIDNLNHKNQSIKELIESKKLLFKNLSDEIKNKEKEINASKEKLFKISEKVASQKVLYEKTETDFKQSTQKLNEIDLSVKHCLNKVQLLEDMEKNMEGFSLSVKNIIKEHSLGALSGICGTVSSIIHVEENYAIAIDTALGASLQNVVVETESHAKAAISFLKNRKIGRATFLPLNIIKGKKISSDSLKNLKGFIGIASDLCNYESKYDGLAEYILGRVIVADNLDNAINLSKDVSYRYKVVTLDGQVVNAGGSLTGGTISKKTGALARTAEIIKLKKDLELFESEKRSVEEKLKNIRENMRLIHEDINKIQDLAVTEKNNIIDLETQKNNLKFKKEVCDKELSDSIKDLNKVCEEVSKCENQIENFNFKETQIKAEIESLNIDKNSVQKINEEFSVKKDSLNSSINNLNIMSMSLKKEIEAIRSEILSYEQSTENKDKKVNELNSKVEFLKSQNEDYANQIENSKIKEETLKEKIEDCKAKDSDLKSRRIDLEKRTVTLRKAEKDLINSRECLVKDLTLMQERRDNFIKKQDNIISRLWDEYGLTESEAREFTNPADNLKESEKKLLELKIKIKGLGTVNLESVEEYKEVSERYKFLSEQVKDIEKSKHELSHIINSLTEDMKNIFTVKFGKIRKYFCSIFKELFEGGEADLVILDPKDILSTGIEISAKPPGKLGLYLDSLSGGEKALVAIALYFAIIKVNPAPFCVLDEIEAALDDVNVSRFAKYLKRINDKTQFVVITHRRGTMEEADILYGVTMQDDGISKVLKLKTNKFPEY